MSLASSALDHGSRFTFMSSCARDKNGHVSRHAKRTVSRIGWVGGVPWRSIARGTACRFGQGPAARHGAEQDQRSSRKNRRCSRSGGGSRKTGGEARRKRPATSGRQIAAPRRPAGRRRRRGACGARAALDLAPGLGSVCLTHGGDGGPGLGAVDLHGGLQGLVLLEVPRAAPDDPPRRRRHRRAHVAGPNEPNSAGAAVCPRR